MKWLLGVCGAGAAVATPQQVLILRDQGIEVVVLLSPNAEHFVSRDALAAFSRNPVFGSVFERSDTIFLPHVELAEWADALVIMPATAAQIARLAAGAADDIISAIAVHSAIPTFVVPALNEAAAANPLVRRNLQILCDAGMEVIREAQGHALRAVDAGRFETGFPSILAVTERVKSRLEESEAAAAACGDREARQG